MFRQDLENVFNLKLFLHFMSIIQISVNIRCQKSSLSQNNTCVSKIFNWRYYYKYDIILKSRYIAQHY